MKTCKLFLFIFLCSSLFADEPLFVRLETEKPLLPLYLTNVIDDNSGFDKSYLKQLEQVLSFDLSHNGMTYLVKPSQEMAKASHPESFENLGDVQQWNALKVHYVIKPRIQNKQLAVRMLSVNNGTGKALDGIALTGNLAQDRRQIHLIADKIHQALFGNEGIASTRIIYTLKRNAATKDPSSDIWEADYDGFNARQVLTNAGYCVTPLYVPPKSGGAAGSICFVSYKTGQPKIYFSSLGKGEPQRFSLLSGNQLMPSLSRQRNKIAFISDVTGNPDLFLQEFDPEQGPIGKPRQIYATHQATQGSPTFSPDGKSIAFVTNKDGSPRIYIMDIPTPDMRLKDIKANLISKANRENSAPSWSPDGTKLAYCAMTNGVRQIWIYDFLKRQEWQLTQGGTHKENPSWAPNNLHLVFNSTGNDVSELYLINLNQSNATKISAGAGEKRFPFWEPRS